MIRRARHLSPRGSIVLVALCVIAVMGIGLAAHLSVSNQATRLANRNFQTGLSKQLAEMGLERALWAFNRNDWTGWTINGTTATRTISFAANKFGSTGATTAIKIRVDNYNAFHLEAVWDSTTRYRMNDLVLYSNQWYRAFDANQNSQPNLGLAWSVAAGSGTATWNNGAYNVGDIVHRSGRWYRCIRAHTNQAPPNAAYWSTAPLRTQDWTPGAYNLNDIVQRDGIWYRCILAHATSQPPPNATYWASAATWSATEAFAGVPPDTTYWNAAQRLPADAWNPATNYVVGNYVAHGGVWYRCIANHANRVPFNSAFWTTTAPVIYTEGTVTLPDGSTTLRTQLRTLVAPVPLFPNAAAASETVTFSAGTAIESYDASRGIYNSNTTPYTNANRNRGWSAIVAGGNTGATAVTLTSPAVRGYVAAPSSPTAPYAPRASFGGSASVKGPDSPATPNVDLTRVSRSPFIPQPDIITPNTGTSTALPNTNATHTLGSPTDTAPRVYVFNGNLNITDNRRYEINGPVRIVVTGQFYLGLNGGTTTEIRINNHATASLEMFIGGDIAIYKNGIVNQTLLPERVAIYGTTTATAPDISTGNAFHGVLYLPNGRFNVLGANRYIYGALSARNLVAGGATYLYYDTSLRYKTFAGVEPSYLLTEWRELTDTVERITF
jgi:hypothetical protein